LAAAYPEIKQYYGLLAGLIFTVPYTVTGLWTGSLADKVKDPRNRVIIFSLAGIAWSLCTYAAGAIDSPAAFALSRFGMGIFVSFNQPFGFALIQDWFP
jgi:MFS family permease